MRLSTALLAILCAVAPPTRAFSQDSSTASPGRADRLLGFWLSSSVAPSTRFGLITDRTLLAAGLRAQYLLETIGPIAIASTIDLVPVAVLSNNPEYVTVEDRTPDGFIIRYKSIVGHSPVFSTGLSPAGLRIYTRSSGAVRYFVGASAGILWFTRDTPIPGSRRLNFNLETGAGIEIVSRRGRVMTVGYRFQHLSNAGTAPLNPGFDAHVLSLGFMRPRSRPQ